MTSPYSGRHVYGEIVFCSDAFFHELLVSEYSPTSYTYILDPYFLWSRTIETFFFIKLKVEFFNWGFSIILTAVDLIMKKSNIIHCEIDKRKLYTTLMVRICDLVADLVLNSCTNIRKADLSGYILVIHNIFVLLNSSFIKGVTVENI